MRPPKRAMEPDNSGVSTGILALVVGAIFGVALSVLWVATSESDAAGAVPVVSPATWTVS